MSSIFCGSIYGENVATTAERIEDHTDKHQVHQHQLSDRTIDPYLKVACVEKYVQHIIFQHYTDNVFEQ